MNVGWMEDLLLFCGSDSPLRQTLTTEHTYFPTSHTISRAPETSFCPQVFSEHIPASIGWGCGRDGGVSASQEIRDQGKGKVSWTLVSGAPRSAGWEDRRQGTEYHRLKQHPCGKGEEMLKLAYLLSKVTTLIQPEMGTWLPLSHTGSVLFSKEKPWVPYAGNDFIFKSVKFKN